MKIKHKNALIIGINYSPERTGSAPYTSGIAEILVESGYCVEALVGIPHYPSWKINKFDKYIFRRSELINGVNVRRFRHFVPATQSMMKRILWETTFLLNVGLSKPLKKPDFIIASSPSLSGGLLGVFFARKYQVPLITIVQDLVGKAVTQSGLQVQKNVRKMVFKIEKFVMQESDYICIVSPKFHNYIRGMCEDEAKIEVVANWTHIQSDLNNDSDIRKQYGWSTNEIIVMHTGNMGMKQDLSNLINAAKLFDMNDKYRIVLCGDGNQRKRLEKEAKGVDKIHFLDSVSEAEYPYLLAAADILVVNERSTVGDMSLPSKLTSYLAIGKPIIAAVNSEGACAQFLTESGGAGIVINPSDPHALKSTIIALNNDVKKREKMAQAAREYAELHLKREIAIEKYKKILKKIVVD